MQVSYTSQELTAMLEPIEVRGRYPGVISGIAALQDAGEGDLTFLGNAKYKPQVALSRASVVLVPPDYDEAPAGGVLHMVVKQPSAALALLCQRIEQQLWPRAEPGVHVSAQVDPAAQVDPSASIGPLCVVEAGAVIGPGTQLQAQVFMGRHARVGADCWLAPGVHVSTECKVGDRVRLHPGVVIGSDGFGYEFVDGRHAKVPQVGAVVVENDVEIGANSTIDRARFSQTRIGAGTKIDNLVQVAHNVIIGKHCLLCAQVGISGSTQLGDYVVLGGQAGVGGHIKLGDGAKLGGQAGTSSSVKAGEFLNGTPAIPYMLERRLAVLQRRLPELFKRVEHLQAVVEELKKASAGSASQHDHVSP